ncbi:MAG TPA: alcohol dehydrogenase catalytic domain-containing protein [Acidimicrobiia bacterium]|nr:alcohol dehydrogenase catalytic domain-containing protein [Acidimicrobiia bacterium]
MKVKAAVIESVGVPLAIEELDLVDPGPDEVRVRMHAASICRSDLHVAETGEGLRFPAVLGHEGAGVVEATGEGVTVEPGAHVVLSWTPRCGRCPAVSRADRNCATSSRPARRAAASTGVRP